MAVRMRLTRVGSKKNPIYRVVVADSRSPRDGRFIEIVGPLQPADRPVDDRVRRGEVKDWLSQGRAAVEHGRAAAEGQEHRWRVTELLAYLARQLVDEPDAVRVEEVERDDALVLQLHVAQDDVGKVIGRQGRIARALRTVVRASGPARTGASLLEIVE